MLVVEANFSHKEIDTQASKLHLILAKGVRVSINTNTVDDLVTQFFEKLVAEGKDGHIELTFETKEEAGQRTQG